jgi:hypothetical protein
MMNTLVKISFLLLLMVTVACAPHFQRPVLDDYAQLAISEKPTRGTPVLKYHHGVLESFSNESSKWNTWSEKIALIHEKDLLKIEAKQVGPDYSNISFKFPSLDFTETSLLRVTAKTEGGAAPALKIILKDFNGRETNASTQSDTIKGSDWKHYYFYFKGNWNQNWPTSGKVDSTIISEMLLYINPGGPEYSGTIYIDDITAVKEENAPKGILSIALPKKQVVQQEDTLIEISQLRMLYSSKQSLDSWWSDKTITLAKKDSIMRVTAYEVGPKYEVFGKSFKAMDFSNTGVLHIKAKAESKTAPLLYMSVTDKAGHGANFDPDTAIISNKGGYNDYYFNFNRKYKQVWPNTALVDSTQIVSLALFINAGKGPFTGKIFIKEVELIEESDIPDEEIERIDLLKKTKKATEQKVIIEKPLETGMLYSPGIDIESWWCDKRMIMIKKDDDMAIMGYDLGPKYEAFGKTFKPMDFTNSGVIRIRAKAESSTMPILSMSLTDKDGHGANDKPQTETITNDTRYKNYFFNFHGKYKQVWPEPANVNSTEIISIILFINAGKTPFTGTLLIDEIEVMTEAEAKKMKAETED